MKRTIGTILFVIYSIIAIIVTVLLLSFNDFKCSEIAGHTVYIVNDDSLEPNYEEGSLLLIKETSDKHVKVGDEVFFYDIINSKEFDFVNEKLSEKNQQGRRIVYTTESGKVFDSDNFVGKATDTKVIPHLGYVLGFLESKWGFLFCIVIVSLILFLQEVFDLVIEIRYGGTKGTKAANTANARKAKAKSKTVTAKTKTTQAKSAQTKTTQAKMDKTKEQENPEEKAKVGAVVETIEKIKDLNEKENLTTEEKN